MSPWRPCAFLALMVAFMCGCTRSIPPVAQGLTIPLGPTQEFASRLRERFPVGSPAQSLTTELRNENFELNLASHSPAGTYSALYVSGGFPCKDEWSVEWTTQADKMATITGY